MNHTRITHPKLGTITVVRRSNSKIVSARWTGSGLRVNVPESLSNEDITKLIATHSTDFERMRPKALHEAGTRLEYDGGLRITLGYAESVMGRTPTSSVTDRDKTLFIRPIPSALGLSFSINVHPGRSFDSPDVQQSIDAAIKAIARHAAPKILIPRARELADKLGLQVDTWEISQGKTVLGLCFPRQRRIKISYMCVFLPSELRDYIICHELAHLTELNHSKDFHSLCNEYLDGRESKLAAELRHFSWPVLR